MQIFFNILQKIRSNRIVSALILSISLLCLSTCSMMMGERYTGAKANNFDGSEFHNLREDSLSRLDLFWYFATVGRPTWPEWIDNTNYGYSKNNKETDSVQITFINHATTLIEIDGMAILSDPIYSERCSPLSWLGPKRVRAPGINFDSLPKIDYVIISHNHYDHCDIPTLIRLNEKFHPTFLIGLGNKDLLIRNGINKVSELNWWDELKINESFKITFTPSQHRANRGMFDEKKTLWGSYFIQGKTKSVFFAGDTGLGPHFSAIQQKLGSPTVSILPVGAYKPEHLLRTFHQSPFEAVEAHKILGASNSVGIHYGTFNLAFDDYLDPIKDLAIALRKAKINENDFLILDFGESKKY